MAPNTQTSAQTIESLTLSYSIPAFNVPVTQNTSFRELKHGFKIDPAGSRARRTAHCDVETQTPPNASNAILAVVQFYSLDGQDVYGPYNIYESETLEVDLDDRDWGLQVIQVMEDSNMSVWIAE